MAKTYSELKEQLVESKAEQMKPEVEEWLAKNEIPFSRVSVNPKNNKIFVEYKETISTKEENKANEYLSSLGDPYQLGVRKMSVTVSESLSTIKGNKNENL